MANEPIDTAPNPAGTGRPVISEDQYREWLDALAPFLRLGHTLWVAIEEAEITRHKDSIYKKYRLNDWFSERVVTLQSYPGKIANDILTKVLMIVLDKIKQGLPVSEDEMKNVRFMAEKHRSAQPYFVNRTEVADVKDDPIGQILDGIERSNYVEVGREAQKQMVASNQPVQNKDEVGKAGDVQAKQPTDAASG